MKLSPTIKYLRIVLFLFLINSCVLRDKPVIQTGLEKPNVIIIMADDLGYGDLGCFGNDHIQTPNIDSLASNGFRFTDFHSNGVVCSPTRAGLLTGKYPQKTGITGVVTAKSHRDVGLPLSELTMAEYLSDLGYATGIVGKWHLGYDTTYSPLNQGFDTFTGFVSGNIDYHTYYDQENYFDWWSEKQQQNEHGYATDLITEHAVSFITKNKDQPFFLYVPHGAPHYPYQGRESTGIRGPEWDGRNVAGTENDIRKIYTEMVEALDDGVGAIINTLEALELSRNTIVFFLSDNGASPNGSNSPFRGHKGQLWEGGHRIPAICYWDSILKPTVSNDLILSMDIFPTIAGIVGGDTATLNGLDGESFQSILHGADPKVFGQRYVYWKSKDRAAVRSGSLKLIRDESQYFLFDLKQDPQEANNLKDKLNQEFELLKGVLKEWEADMDHYPVIS